ncbi:MAG: GAF domain-containing protein [Chitinophagales bacterium]
MCINIMRKEDKYELTLKEAEAVLENEENTISIMATLVALLKQNFDSIYWIGFYIVDNGVLKIGPYQGTIGCLTIEPSRGVCGRAYTKGLTQIVDDVHKDPQHIACDPKSNSEIVVPVFNYQDQIIAVLDIDSEIFGNFDEIDQLYLERLINSSFKTRH